MSNFSFGGGNYLMITSNRVPCNSIYSMGGGGGGGGRGGAPKGGGGGGVFFLGGGGGGGTC